MDQSPSASRILDGRALKAIAHPIRLRLLEELLDSGPSTASELGRRIDESSGSTSYHLRALADAELIVEASDLGTGRERWWRAAPGGWTLEGFELLDRPDTRDDAIMVLDGLRQARVDRLTEWHESAGRWGPDWVAASVNATSRMVLTKDEMAEMRDELVAVLDRWRALVGERRDAATAPDGSAMVNVSLDVFPFARPTPNPDQS